MDDYERERRRRRAKKRRATAMGNPPAGSGAGSPLLNTIRQELDKHGFTALLGSDGDALHLDCRFFPPEDAHYRDEHGEPRLLVSIHCSQPTHVYIAAPGSFDVRDAVNKTAIATAVPRLEQQVADAQLAYHAGCGAVVPFVAVPNGAVAADPSLVLKATIGLLTDVHQLAPVMGNLIRTGQAAFDATTFAIPAYTDQEREEHMAMLDRRGRNETNYHAKRYTHEVERRFRRFIRRFGAVPDLAKRVLGQIGHSPRVLVAQLFKNQVAAINAQADFRAHPAMLKALDRLLRQERWKA